MWELPQLLEKLDPSHWGWVKWTFLTLGLLTFVGIRCRKNLRLHVILQLLAFIGLGVIFAYGVITRGALGTAATHPHGWLFFTILVPHILAGIVYAVLALTLMVLGWFITQRGKVQYLKLHRILGKCAAWSLYCSVALALPL